MNMRNQSQGARRGPAQGQGGPHGHGARDESPTIDLSGIEFGSPPKASLFDEVAALAAETIAQGGKDVNKASQLRRFYDELVMWQEKVGSSAERFSECEPYIRMLKAKVAYARARRHVDANFEALLRRVIDEAKGPAQMRTAKLFMEAFMAYHKANSENKQR